MNYLKISLRKAIPEGNVKSDYISVVRLERLHAKVLVLLYCANAFRACLCGSHRCDVRNSVLDRSLSDVAVVSHAVLTGRSVDDELNISVRDSVADVGSVAVGLPAFTSV